MPLKSLGTSPPIGPVWDNRQRCQLAFLIAGYVLVFFVLAYRRYAVFGNDTSDFGYFNNMFWYTLRGRPFYVCAAGMCSFGTHTAFLWAQLLPLYWLFPGVAVLIFAQSLFIGLAAVPLYLIARRLFQSHRAALIVALAFLLFPPIVSQHVNQLEEPPFVAVYLLFTLYFWLENRFERFLLFAAVSCLGRENVSLTIAMFGLYGLVQRRSLKWIITPALLGLAYFFLAVFVIMPAFRQGHAWHAMAMFTYLGNTPTSIVSNALTHPGRVLSHLMGAENVQYFTFLIQPLAWVLPFLGSVWVLALPDLALNLVSDNGALKVIAWHYNVFTGSFLFVSALYGIRKVAGWLRQNRGDAPYELVLIIGILVLCLAHWFLWFFPRQYSRLPHHDSLVRAIQKIPADKSVLVPVRIQGHITSRPRYDHIGYFQQNPAYAKQFEYVMLDANERQYPPFVTQEFFDSFYKNPTYQLLFAENNVLVFRRLGGESDWKIGPL